MQKRWLIKSTPDQQIIDQLISDIKVEPALASILAQRGIHSFDEAQYFFRPKLEDLHDPFLMKDLKEAVDRINLAISNSEKIMIFGDYDVDGTTAVATMWNVLIEQYEKLEFYIPDRYAEGYGISELGIKYASEQGITLIIALDCGIKSIDKVAFANSLGIDFIVCDHHLPGEELPACIVLDPKRVDCEYPYKELSGCGVGFKLLQGLCTENEWDTTTLFQQLDLLAISIGADIVPVTGENRILCYHGMQLLNREPRLGIQEILRVAKKNLPLNLTSVIFTIAPRINAAGRIHSGRKSVEMMISNDLEDLKSIAASIEEDNIERKDLDKSITAEAFQQIEEDKNFKHKISTVVFNENWHKGVVGIVASRLIEKHYRPTIVLTESNGVATGSARSIRGLNMHDALEQCSDLLEQFGGHAFAAGMSMPLENVTLFKERFDEVVQKLIQKEDLIPQQIVDYELHFDELFLKDELLNKVPKFKRIIDQFEPTGPGNMKPIFTSKNVFISNVRILKEEHLKVVVGQPKTHVTVDAIGFSMVDKMDLINSKEPLDILYTIETNSWRDLETLQLNLKDIRLSI
ncbi:MAG: single-stranded-DNA-specific exonuclease RecJ [Crocinitomicaceae bacterium]|nr:single-stranded-DNA-specific exonuclease RecJ [Crocinitomicaceae bacterium]